MRLGRLEGGWRGLDLHVVVTRTSFRGGKKTYLSLVTTTPLSQFLTGLPHTDKWRGGASRKVEAVACKSWKKKIYTKGKTLSFVAVQRKDSRKSKAKKGKKGVPTTKKI